MNREQRRRLSFGKNKHPLRRTMFMIGQRAGQPSPSVSDRPSEDEVIIFSCPEADISIPWPKGMTGPEAVNEWKRRFVEEVGGKVVEMKRRRQIDERL